MKPETPPPLPRRLVIAQGAALLAAPALLLPGRARAAALRPTPAQTEGPFYPVQIPADHDADLLAAGALRYSRGQAAWVEGTVSDTEGRPLAGAAVEIWQCDHDGRYHHPGDGDRADRAFQGFGRFVTGRDARWRFRTLRPVAYGARAPHIHLKVKLGARELLTTQLYVEGDAGNVRDGLWRRLAPEDRALVTLPFRAAADGLVANAALVVQA